MATVTIKNANGIMDTDKRQKSLQKIEAVMTTDNLIFLAGLCSKSDINEKLKSKKLFIKSYL